MQNQTSPDDDPVVKEKKKRDFRIGVGLFFGVNILLWFLMSQLSSLSLGEFQAILPYVVNIGLIIFLSMTHRSDMALGFLGGFFYALMITLVLGVILTAACFLGAF